jgi:hypothetical protein
MTYQLLMVTRVAKPILPGKRKDKLPLVFINTKNSGNIQTTALLQRFPDRRCSELGGLLHTWLGIFADKGYPNTRSSS